MPYHVRIDEESEIVYLAFEGSCDRTEHQNGRDEAFQACRERGFSRLRVDLRTGSMAMSNQELFEFGKSLDAANETGHIRIAVLIREDDGATNLTVAVAQTRDVAIQVFLTEEDALAWLLE